MKFLEKLFWSLLGPVLVVVVLIVLPGVEKHLFYLPLLFALSIVLFQSRHFKIHPLWGGLLFILQTYTVFLGLAIVIYFSEDLLQDLILVSEDRNAALKGILLVTVGGYLAALLLYYFSTYLFHIPSKRRGYVGISVAYLLIILIMQVFSNHEYLQFGVEKFTSFLISWTLLISIAFNLNLSFPRKS